MNYPQIQHVNNSARQSPPPPLGHNPHRPSIQDNNVDLIINNLVKFIHDLIKSPLIASENNNHYIRENLINIFATSNQYDIQDEF